MPMRTECKHFESRTYATGETVRKCDLDLAPEAPWRCPAECPRYERRLADVAWSHGTMVVPPTVDEPSGEGIAELLGATEEIINAAGPAAFAELQAERTRGQRSWRRFFKRRR